MTDHDYPPEPKPRKRARLKQLNKHNRIRKRWLERKV